MATRASTFVSASGLNVPVPLGGLHLEIFRCQGGTAGDTTTITPTRGRYIVAAVSGLADTSISTTGTGTNVVLTHVIAATSTNATFDALLWVAE